MQRKLDSVETPVLFSPSVTESSPCAVQFATSNAVFRSEIIDILFRSADIRYQVLRNRAQIVMCLGRQIFRSRGSQISDPILQIRVTVKRVPKFGDYRPRRLGAEKIRKRNISSLSEWPAPGKTNGRS